MNENNIFVLLSERIPHLRKRAFRNRGNTDAAASSECGKTGKAAPRSQEDCHPDPFAGDRTTRDLDLRYLDRHPSSWNPPYFSFVWDHASPVLQADPQPSLVDIGCANGAFVNFVLSRDGRVTCAGVDGMESLVDMARTEVPRAEFLVGDIRHRETLPRAAFTVVTMLTLHSHFDDIEGWLGNALGLCAPGGRLLIFGPFNDEPVDVLVRLRPSAGSDGGWMPGWNLHSRDSFASSLERRSVRYEFHDFTPPDVVTDRSDPLRTRPVMIDGAPAFTNGAGLILRFALLEIRT